MSITSAFLVFQNKHLDALSHATQSVTEFLVDLYILPLTKLVAHGSHRLLTQIFQESFGKCFSSSDIEDAMAVACANGNLPVLEILHCHAPLLFTTTRFLDEAACHGQLQVVHWLVNHRRETFSMEAIRGAIRGGFADLLQFLLDNNHLASHCHDCLWCAMEMAIQSARFQVFEWLWQRQQQQFLCLQPKATSASTANADANAKQHAESNPIDPPPQGFTSNCVFKKHHAIETLLVVHSPTSLWTQSLHQQRSVREVFFGRLAALKSANQVLPWLKQRFPKDIATFGGETMRNAAVQGDLELVTWLHQTGTSKCTRRALYEAARNGHLQVLQFILMNLDTTTNSLPSSDGSRSSSSGNNNNNNNSHLEPEECVAARNGHTDIVCFLHESLGRLPSSMNEAARNGHLDVVRYLHQVGHVDVTPQAMDNAAIGGHDQVVEYLFDHTHQPCSPQALNEAAAKGFVQTVQRFPQICSSTTLEAACCGANNLSLVKFLVARVHLAITARIICLAAVHSSLEVLEFLCQVHAARNSAKGPGNVAALANHRARPQRSGWLGSTLEEVARRWRFDILDFLCQQFPSELQVSDSQAFVLKCAIKRGHLPTVQRFHELNSSAFTWSCMDLAAKRGHLAIVRFLHDHRHEGCTFAAMDKAAAKGHLRVVRFLHYHRHEGCSTKAMDQAAANGHLHIVRFLHLHRREGCTTKAMDQAATNGFLPIVKFLHENRQEGCTTAAIDGAAINGLLEMVQFLWTNRKEGCTSQAWQKSLDEHTVTWIRSHWKHYQTASTE